MQDRSDDEESDHNTSDTYPSHMRGRVSPSPYTANTERARQFNVSYPTPVLLRLISICLTAVDSNRVGV